MASDSEIEIMHPSRVRSVSSYHMLFVEIITSLMRRREEKKSSSFGIDSQKGTGLKLHNTSPHISILTSYVTTAWKGSTYKSLNG